VDSALVYRGLDVGSAKPDAAMQATTTRGRVPLLVGGTGLYFRALLRGLSELPEADPDLRARLEERRASEGVAALHAALAARDPAAAARIHPNDPQRVLRALEVIELTGRPLSEQQRAARDRFPYRVLKLALMPPRAWLHARIAARFDAMLDAGFLDEARRLRASPGFDPERPAFRAVGYRQAFHHLDGRTDAAGFRAEAIAATRQLAKRQTTWLRGEHDAVSRDPTEPGFAAAAASLRDAFLGAEAPQAH
jgi:tRNA dimethylallyltransferase